MSRSSSLDLATVEDRLMRDPARDLGREGWRHAAVAAVFREGAQGAELLFIQRAVHEKDPWSGQIGFPGGRSEEGDPSLEHTAARETHEELDLDLLQPESVRRLGALDQLQARARRKILPLAITPFAFAWLGGAPPELSPNHEVDSAFWVPLSTLADPARRIEYSSQRDALDRVFQALDLGEERVLWGLTHYMTIEILFRLGLVEDVQALTLPREP